MHVAIYLKWLGKDTHSSQVLESFVQYDLHKGYMLQSFNTATEDDFQGIYKIEIMRNGIVLLISSHNLDSTKLCIMNNTLFLTDKYWRMRGGEDEQYLLCIFYLDFCTMNDCMIIQSENNL